MDFLLYVIFIFFINTLNNIFEHLINNIKTNKLEIQNQPGHMEFNTIGYVLSKQGLLLEEAYIFITEMDGDFVINETSLKIF